jgi:hypothetical protein
MGAPRNTPQKKIEKDLKKQIEKKGEGNDSTTPAPWL